MRSQNPRHSSAPRRFVRWPPERPASRPRANERALQIEIGDRTRQGKSSQGSLALSLLPSWRRSLRVTYLDRSLVALLASVISAHWLRLWLDPSSCRPTPLSNVPPTQQSEVSTQDFSWVLSRSTHVRVHSWLSEDRSSFDRLPFGCLLSDMCERPDFPDLIRLRGSYTRLPVQVFPTRLESLETCATGGGALAVRTNVRHEAAIPTC